MSEAETTQAAKHSRNRWRLPLAIAVLVVLVIAVLIHMLGGKKAAPVAAPQVVEAAKAVRGDMPETLSALGTVSPTATVTVLPQLSGYLTEVGYHEGQEVEKGQFLAQIDPRQYQISKQQHEAQLAKDRATLAQARSDLARYQTLRAQHSITEQTVSDQEFAVQQDAATVKSDQAAIAQDELDLEYCRITAPVAGRVGLRLVDPGNYVTASSTTGIVVITTIKPTTVQFTVPQNEMGKVMERFHAGGQLQVDAYDSNNVKKLATGTLYALGNQMDTGTGTVSLRATFANDDEALFPEEFVNVVLHVDTLKQVVLVPTAAVLSGAPGDFVYLVNANGTVSVHKVVPGASDGRNTVITSGLAPGDTVVVDGMDRLSDGSKVKLAAAKPASAQSAPAPARSAAAAQAS